MAYWWVNQGRTYKEERDGGYLWAPMLDKGGNRPHHWRTMDDVREGDLVFSYLGKQIRAVSVALGAAVPSTRPAEFSADISWEKEGLRVPCAYTELARPLPILGGVWPRLRPLMPTRYSPLMESGSGNTGYLYRLTPRAGRFLLEAIEEDLDQAVDEEAVAVAPNTERHALARSRVGQGRFRRDQLARWRRCAVSGVSEPALLVASHIKPWRDSNNAERLDPDNGLLLCAHYDRAFDAGLITFDESGVMRLASSLGSEEALRAGLAPDARLRRVTPGMRRYLAHHREEVFRGR